jgi:hypothetical protein
VLSGSSAPAFLSRLRVIVVFCFLVLCLPVSNDALSDPLALQRFSDRRSAFPFLREADVGQIEINNNCGRTYQELGFSFAQLDYIITR